MSSQLLFVIILALVFEFINGMRDSSNIVATMISSRAFRPQTALGVTAVSEFLGPFLFGVTVAKTVGDDIVDSHLLTLEAIVACLLAAIIWNLITWFLGIPSSSSHALIGGLIGVVASRSEAVRLGLERLVDRHRRDAVGARITTGYRSVPQTEAEVGWADESSVRMIAEEPW